MILEGIPRQIAESLVDKHGRLAEILSIMLRRRDAWRYKTAMVVWNDLYKESQRLQRLKDVAEWLNKQAHPKLPPWLTTT